MQSITINTTVVDETTTFSIREVCTYCDISPDLLIQMVEHGLFDLDNEFDDNSQIDLKTLKRVEAAFRLHRDLEINISGVALVLELNEEIEKLRDEISVLQEHLAK